MTNIFSSERKVILKDRLFKMGVKHLEQEGWKVEEVKMGKSSVRQIRKGDQTQLASIRTSQDQWLSNAREKDDSAWSTLENVDVVVIVSVNDQGKPDQRSGSRHPTVRSEGQPGPGLQGSAQGRVRHPRRAWRICSDLSQRLAEPCNARWRRTRSDLSSRCRIPGRSAAHRCEGGPGRERAPPYPGRFRGA